MKENKILRDYYTRHTWRKRDKPQVSGKVGLSNLEKSPYPVQKSRLGTIVYTVGKTEERKILGNQRVP